MTLAHTSALSLRLMGTFRRKSKLFVPTDMTDRLPLPLKKFTPIVGLSRAAKAKRWAVGLRRNGPAGNENEGRQVVDARGRRARGRREEGKVAYRFLCKGSLPGRKRLGLLPPAESLSCNPRS